jgi:cyclic pyranopterin phosphate synthase
MEKMDKLKIDSHKLIYHIPRVFHWLQGKNVYPLYVEIAPYGGCNQRCNFCAFDYLKYKPTVLDEACLKKFIKIAAKKGIKSIMYAGEGEPLLHKNISRIVRFTKYSGIDVAITSNAVMFSKELAQRCIPYLSWFRASINAGTAKTYSSIHRTDSRDFAIVLRNLKEAVRIRNKKKYDCTIGAQFLLLPQNYSEAELLARKSHDIGLDYLIIKPYSQHPASINRVKSGFTYENLSRLEKKLEGYAKRNFSVIFRRHSMEKLDENIPYGHCLGLPFATFISSKGDIYPCSIFFGEKEFAFGNLYKEGFTKIWEGKRRKRILDFICSKWNIEKCRKICRLDEINRYLWELKNPVKHSNFI